MKFSRKSPAAFFSFLLIYLMSWHLALIAVSSGGLFRELKFLFMLKGFEYIAASAVITVLVFLMMKLSAGKKIRRISVRIAAVIFFTADCGIRALDWGVIYFSGQHVENEFWYHAFYSDGTSFILTKQSGILLLSWLTATMIFIYILRRMTDLAIDAAAAKTPGIVKPNALIAATLSTAVMLPLITFSSSNSIKSFYMDLPESKVVGSFIDYAFGGRKAVEVKRSVLRKETVDKLKKCGVIVYSTNTEYPLMKKSIYVNLKDRTMQKPVLKPGQNIIIIFVESLSQFLMMEDQHGYKGITPNLHAMLSESYEFTSMYDANYPTIKGTIGTLSSSLYMVDKIQGIGEGFRTPVPCNFLFLSNVLEKYGYTAEHIQGGSGIFGGMKDLFEKKQGYSKFLGWENVELHSYAKNKRNSDWGLRDEDVFRYAVKEMEENDNKHPFVLSISTIDMHPPYDALYKTPNAQGIKLLNCLYSTDKGIGVFWDYFKKSRYYKNTAVIVVADHAMGGGVAYDTFLGKYKKETHPFCDFITCFMYLPGNNAYKGKKNTTFCTNLDILPTLMDMMNIDCENPFIGLSIFSERSKYPFPVSLFDLSTHQYLAERMSPREKAFASGIGWNGDDQAAIKEFFTNLAITRGFYPPIIKEKK